MIPWVQGLLERWAAEMRAEAAVALGLASSPSWVGGAALGRYTRARRRPDGRRASVLRASLGGGLTASGVSSGRGGPRQAVLRGDVDRLDRFVGGLPADDQALLAVMYVEGAHLTEAEKAGRLGVSVPTLWRRLDRVHVSIDRHFRPAAYGEAVDAGYDDETDRLISALLVS